MNSIYRRIEEMNQRVADLRRNGLYFYLQPISELDGVWVTVNGRRMLLFAGYSYLGLLGHPKITAAAQEALARYGTGTHGVRILAGTLPLHDELEQTIARFKKAEAAIVYSSGYVTNLATVSALVMGRNDVVICDKYNHASIVDGCLLSRAKFARFRHNDMADLERCLQQAGTDAGKLVVVDAVFSMDGDIINLPEVSRLCREYEALLMVDEAHSVGVLGETGHGIEEHFGLEDAIDLYMGTLSKPIPSVGGYVAREDTPAQRQTLPGRAQGTGLQHAQQRDPHRAHHLRRGRAGFPDDEVVPGGEHLRAASGLPRRAGRAGAAAGQRDGGSLGGGHRLRAGRL